MILTYGLMAAMSWAMSRRARVCRRISWAALALAAAMPSVGEAQTVDSLSVLTYNVLLGGATYGPLSRTVGVIQAAQADVIGIQEVGGNTQAIAASLGYYYHGFNSDVAILSRYPITQVLDQGVRLQLSPTQDAYLFNVHLSAFPYQPYDIRDGAITTEAQAIAEAQATRGGQVTSVLNAMAPAIATGTPIFLTGDFNEPSHLDWTQAAANAGLHFGKKVDWPASQSVVDAGFSDSFRQLRPDEINDRGNTWTPGSPAPAQDPDEVFDRIDFVYYRGVNVTPLSAQTLGYDANDPDTDIGIQPYPSDHRSVVVQFGVPTCSLFGDLSGNCSLGVEDWTQFRAGQLADLTGLSLTQANMMGDLNGDFRNDHADFVLFKEAFEAAHGTGSFAALLTSVPEPSAFILVTVALAMCCWPIARQAKRTTI